MNDAPAGIPVDEQLDLVQEVPGEIGVIDFVGFLKCLKEIGYDGPIVPSVPGSKILKGMSIQEAAHVCYAALVKLWRLRVSIIFEEKEHKTENGDNDGA